MNFVVGYFESFIVDVVQGSMSYTYTVLAHWAKTI